VSEAQKYQGKLYEAKEKENKGKLKQDSWTDSVQKSIEEAGDKISPQTKVLLDKLLGFDNIPRKQKPFTNFVQNSLKLWDQKKISEIWEVINAASNAMRKPQGQQAATSAVPLICLPCIAPDAAPEKADIAVERKWLGWKRALDDELKVAGGELPWKRLRDSLVKAYKERAPGLLEKDRSNDVDKEALGLEALAAIPQDYLSSEDELVRLPQ
jgi:cell growth-regulating nucleolar protein